MPIACKRFMGIGPDFWAYGVGAFCWGEIEHPDGKIWHCLYLLVPSHLENGGALPLCLYPSREENNWASPGLIRGWDGDEDQPTLTPSILVQTETGDGWHGFLTAGELRAV